MNQPHEEAHIHAVVPAARLCFRIPLPASASACITIPSLRSAGAIKALKRPVFSSIVVSDSSMFNLQGLSAAFMHCMWHPPRCTVGSIHPGPRARGATEGVSLQQVHVTLAEWWHLFRALSDDYLSLGLCVSPSPSSLSLSCPLSLSCSHGFAR